MLSSQTINTLSSRTLKHSLTLNNINLNSSLARASNTKTRSSKSLCSYQSLRMRSSCRDVYKQLYMRTPLLKADAPAKLKPTSFFALLESMSLYIPDTRTPSLKTQKNETDQWDIMFQNAELDKNAVNKDRRNVSGVSHRERDAFFKLFAFRLFDERRHAVLRALELLRKEDRGSKNTHGIRLYATQDVEKIGEDGKKIVERGQTAAFGKVKKFVFEHDPAKPNLSFMVDMWASGELVVLHGSSKDGSGEPQVLLGQLLEKPSRGDLKIVRLQVEEKSRKYFGYLARCEGNVFTTTLKIGNIWSKSDENAEFDPAKF